MSRSAPRNYSSRTRTTTGKEPQYDVVLIEPPKGPPKKPAAKNQWTRERTHSKNHPKEKPAASKGKSPTEQFSAAKHPARKPSSAKYPSPKDHATEKSSLKQEAALSTHPFLGYLMINGEHNLSPADSVEALRLPCDGSKFRITSIALTEIGRHDTRLEDCTEIEKWLRRFPKMKDLDGHHTFSWKDRQLLAINAEGLGGSYYTRYMIYVCCEKQAKPARNEYLAKLSGLDIYGDCFLFKIHLFDEDGDGDPEFLHIGPESVQDLKQHGATEDILRELLTFEVLTEELKKRGWCKS